MIITDIDINSNINQKPICMTIGNFDGVHRGHQYIINELINEAKKLNLETSVLSFFPHPRVYFNNDIENFNIITDSHKEALFRNLNIDKYFRLKFDNSIASMSANDFVNDLLIEKLKLKFLIIGENFKFGVNRTGNIDFLKKIIIEKNFSLNVVNSIKSNENDTIFSSSVIREKIKNDKFEDVKKYLGRHWSIKGKVQEGDKRARKMNFPTANILSPNTILPKKGVYVVRVIIDKVYYSGIANFGRRPTFGGKKVLLEVHIFDFQKEIYGAELTVEFINFIREEIKFDNLDQLKNQVETDKEKAKSFLKYNK